MEEATTVPVSLVSMAKPEGGSGLELGDSAQEESLHPQKIQ